MADAGSRSLPLEAPVRPMKARARETPPAGEGWAYEPKWDGFRVIAFGAGEGEEVRMFSRNGRDLLRYFPELRPALAGLPPGTVVDGEALAVVGDATSFDALQLRIHPARSRIDRLASEIPAWLVVFDLLAHDGEDITGAPYRERRARLEKLFPSLESPPWHLTPVTYDLEEAARWFNDFEAAGCDGIIAKRVDGAYIQDKREWIKWKHRRDADCVVGGYRVHKDGGKLGSILLGLYDQSGDLHFVGHCSGFPDSDRTELLRQLEKIRSRQSFGGEEGVRRPGAPSRWATERTENWVPVEPEVVAAVSYDQLEGNRFRHATRFERWRPDKPPAECTLDQLIRPVGAGFSQVVGGEGSQARP